MTIEEYIRVHDHELEPFLGTVPKWVDPQDHFPDNERADCYASTSKATFVFLWPNLGIFHVHRQEENRQSGILLDCMVIGGTDEDKKELDNFAVH